MRWRVALIDSGATATGLSVRASARFSLRDERVTCEALRADPTGHGTRIARLIADVERTPELLIAQVFETGAPTTAVVVAAAIRWAVAGEAHLLHLSLGLTADRTVLRAAIAAANAAGCIIVAATPARGVPSFPAGYPKVIQASGDARCESNEISWLHPSAMRFGGCPRAVGAPAEVGGASVGAAHVTQFIVRECREPGASMQAIAQRLRERATYTGRERRS